MIGDRTNCLLLAMKGDILRMDEVLSRYRLVEKKDAKNYQSRTRQKNIRGEEYRYLCHLEDFEKRPSGLPIGGSFPNAGQGAV